MIYALITVLIILVVLVYQKLNRKIQILEQKINDLSKDKITTEQLLEIPQETIRTESLLPDKIDLEQKTIPEIIEGDSEPEKDWLAPLLILLNRMFLQLSESLH
ncbi:hypothetical protein [Chryseobacterium indoltheticum]|uniref:hypothetical protein n=1 Tax=Chryseobacterium indoltheticum TaxID=254 RepID=UPI003F4993C1